MSRFYDFNALELMEMAPISIFSRNKNTEIFLDDQLLGRVRISTLRNENETFSQLNSITYIGVFFAFGDLFAPSLAVMSFVT